MKFSKLKTLGISALLWMCATSASAEELSYRLQSPLLGGTNSGLLQIENSRIGLHKQAQGKREAEELAKRNAEQQAINNSPGARFANALQSQLFMSISQQLSQRITGMSAGQSGSFQSGDVQVAYTHTGTFINVVITTPNGTSTVELPTGQ